ncbi:MAG: outer membrane protein assembly factor BamC [Gammaproteobacteria bacterium]|nr:outer membrane protein assembly factor BamC [Gammaproteobacteria bacterium]
MNYYLNPVSFLLLLISLTGCSWFGSGDLREKLENGYSEPTQIPPGMDAPQFLELMPIPAVNDARGLVGTEYEIRRPEALSTRFGVDQIVIKKLGDQQWVFLDIPPSVVWPKIVQFWEANNLHLDEANPSDGILTSQWITAREGSAESVFQSISLGTVYANTRAANLHQFRLSLEPGVRSGSSEIYLLQRQMKANAPYRLDTVAWQNGSDDLDLENEILKKIAFYLGENISQGTISMLATGLTESRTRLIPDRFKPVLLYKLDFNRAWATVGDALENANVDVKDLNRSTATYFVNYRLGQNPKPGFFSKLFSREAKGEVGDENSYQVMLEEQGSEIAVTVFDGEAPADGLVAERLLKIIKEYST